MSIDLTRLGMWSEDTAYRVEAAQLAAYAAATNDDHPPHVSGVVAPPAFAVVPGSVSLATAAGQFLSDDVRRFSVHASQDTQLHHTLTPGMVVSSRTAPVGVHPRPSGTAITLRTETRDGRDDLLNEHYTTLFLRGVRYTANVGQRAPDHRAPAGLRDRPPVASIAYAVDADQTYRYADASGDRSRIHLDDGFARSVGLPGIILHGMCTMAITSRAVVHVACGGESRRLRRLAVAFARPVLPGQTITVRLWADGRMPGGARFVFDAINPAGKAVIQDGLAEVAD